MPFGLDRTPHACYNGRGGVGRGPWDCPDNRNYLLFVDKTLLNTTITLSRVFKESIYHSTPLDTLRYREREILTRQNETKSAKILPKMDDEILQMGVIWYLPRFKGYKHRGFCVFWRGILRHFEACDAEIIPKRAKTRKISLKKWKILPKLGQFSRKKRRIWTFWTFFGEKLVIFWFPHLFLYSSYLFLFMVLFRNGLF